MEIKDILILIGTILIATGLVVFMTSLIKVGFFRLFHFLPTKKLFIEFLIMHLIIVILIVLLVMLMKNYSIPGIFRVAGPIYIVYSLFEAFYVYDKYLTYEPIHQYTFSMILSSMINMFLMTFLVYQAIYIILF